MKENKNEIIYIYIIFFVGVIIGGFLGFIEMKKDMEKYRYDVNRDGKVTSTDYVLIKNYIMEE